MPVWQLHAILPCLNMPLQMALPDKVNSQTTTEHPPRPPSKCVQAADAAGERYELHPDGNSLDFFKGLVRKKLPA